MENASKALLIAGAILLVIAIIAIAVGIVSRTQNTVNQTQIQMSSMEIQMHNEQFKVYESNGSAFDKSFEEMRECVRMIIALNTLNENNRDKIIYLTPYIVNGGGNSCFYYLDDKKGNYNDQKLKHPSWNHNYTIQEIYNASSDKDYVINANNNKDISLYNITFQTDEKGYINYVIIKKQAIGQYMGGPCS